MQVQSLKFVKFILGLTFLFLLSMTVKAEKVKVSLKEGLKVKHNDSEFQLQGRIMWDYDRFDKAFNEGESGYHSELRHTRLTFKSEFQKKWRAKLQIDIEQADDSTDLTTGIADIYIQYVGWDHLEMTIGKTKEPFSLEQMTSSKDISVIERSMATSAFSPGRHVGVGLSHELDKMTWALGLYEAEDDEESSHYALTGRLTYTPWSNQKHLLHLGLAGSLRELEGESYKIKEEAEVHTAKKVVTSGKTLADQVQLLGLEAAWVKGPLSLQAEYMTARIKAEIEEDASYAGYYLQASYFLTKESRPYKYGIFEQVKPNHSFGAWELVARYSVLDAQDNQKGVKAANITLGVNYFINDKVRLMANYIHTDLTEEEIEETQGHALSLRLQYRF